MDKELFWKDLQTLRRAEEIGRCYFEKYGCELNFRQYLYLLEHPSLKDPISHLNRPSALKEQDTLEKSFHNMIPNGELTSSFNMSADRDIETEQLLRYVHFSAHRHDFVEFVCVLSGTCIHTIDAHEFVHPAGDFAIVPPGIMHEHSASPDCVCLTTKVRSERFLALFSGLIQENSLLSGYFSQILTMPAYHCALTLSGGPDPFIRETMLTIYDQQQKDLPYSREIIVKLWEVLFAYYLQNYQDTVRFLEADSFRNLTTSEILNYIFANYQTITLNETAHHFHFTPAYLSTKIHEMTGKTFSRLLLEYRLQRSVELLTQSDKKLYDICEDIGYHDVSQFIRSFKQYYGTTPVQYRKRKTVPCKKGGSHASFSS